MVMLVAGGWCWAGVAASWGQREGDNGSFNSGSSGSSPQAALVFSQITKPWYMELEPHEQHRHLQIFSRDIHLYPENCKLIFSVFAKIAAMSVEIYFPPESSKCRCCIQSSSFRYFIFCLPSEMKMHPHIYLSMDTYSVTFQWITCNISLTDSSFEFPDNIELGSQ